MTTKTPSYGLIISRSTTAFQYLFLILAIIFPFGKGHTRAECYSRLKSFDRDGDGLLNRNEFVEMSNSMGTVENSLKWSFENLPTAMQDMFTFMSRDSEYSAINLISTSSLADSKSDAMTECEFFDMVMANTNKSANNFARKTQEENPTPSLLQCFVGIVVAESSNPTDNLMNREEYVMFVNRFSGEAFGDDFSVLPEALRNNFENLAQRDGQIFTFGVESDENPSQTQQDFLNQICTDTSAAINNASEQQPTTSRQIQLPTTRPTRPIAHCFVGMLTSEGFEKDDDKMDQDEYVSFLNFLEPGAFTSTNFNDLSQILQDNFSRLALNGSINIKDVVNPDDEQREFLQRVCDDTNTAITLDLYPPATLSPQSQPTTPRPTRPPTSSPTRSTQPSSIFLVPSNSPSTSPSGRPTDSKDEIEVVSQFIISNSIGLRASDFNRAGNDEKKKLDAAFAATIRFIIDKIFTNVGRFMRSRRRLDVNYIRSSTRDFTDRGCPPSAPSGSFCQNVVAVFHLGISGEEMLQLVADKAKDEVNKVIFDGKLQEELSAITSAIRVEFEEGLENQSSLSPSFTPSVVPFEDQVGTRSDDSNGHSFAFFTGIAMAALIILLFVVSFLFYRKSKRNNTSKESVDSKKSEATDNVFDDGFQAESDGEDTKENSIYAFDPPTFAQQSKVAGRYNGLQFSSSDDSDSSESSSDESVYKKSDSECTENSQPVGLVGTTSQHSVGSDSDTSNDTEPNVISQTQTSNMVKKTSSLSTESDSNSSESDDGWEDGEESSSYAEDSDENLILVKITNRDNDGVTQDTSQEVISNERAEVEPFNNKSSLGGSSLDDRSLTKGRENSFTLEGFETLHTSEDEAELYDEPSSSISLSPPRNNNYKTGKAMVKPELESIALESIREPTSNSDSRDFDRSDGSDQLDRSSNSGSISKAMAQSEENVKTKKLGDNESFIQEEDNGNIGETRDKLVQEAGERQQDDYGRFQNNSSSYSGSDSNTYTNGSFIDHSSYTDESDTRTESFTEEYRTGGDSESYMTEGISTTAKDPAQLQREQEIRTEIEALIRVVVPKEKDNVDAMMKRFKGREEELLQTLKTMQERGVPARVRVAVKRGKGLNSSQSSSQAYESEQSSPISSQIATKPESHNRGSSESGGSSYTSGSYTSAAADESESHDEGPLSKFP